LTTHAELAASADVRATRRRWRKRRGCRRSDGPQTAHGGNAAHADPASLPAVLLISGARFVTAGPGGERTIGGRRLLQGTDDHQLRDDEVLTAVLVAVECAAREAPT
jgi:hypothetical protein